jgi:hypothetical protein
MTAQNLVDLIERAIRDATSPFALRLNSSEAEIATLKNEVAVLKSQPLPKYCGIHGPGGSYVSGSLVTRNGGLWLAMKDTAETPGDGCTSWRLVVKEGRARE